MYKSCYALPSTCGHHIMPSKFYYHRKQSHDVTHLNDKNDASRNLINKSLAKSSHHTSINHQPKTHKIDKSCLHCNLHSHETYKCPNRYRVDCRKFIWVVKTKTANQ